eukprot:3203216-Pyramimonas_sp.AAC.1
MLFDVIDFQKAPNLKNPAPPSTSAAGPSARPGSHGHGSQPNEAPEDPAAVPREPSARQRETSSPASESCTWRGRACRTCKTCAKIAGISDCARRAITHRSQH